MVQCYRIINLDKSVVCAAGGALVGLPNISVPENYFQPFHDEIISSFIWVFYYLPKTFLNGL